MYMSDLDLSRYFIITDRKLCRDSLPAQIERLMSLPENRRMHAVVLREKDLSSDEYMSLAAAISDIAGDRLIIHSRIDIAKRLGIQKIHMTLQGMRALSHDKAFFSEKGVSVHSVSEAVEAEQLGASYIFISNIYETACKMGLPGKGEELIREVKRKVSIPVVALGGIGIGDGRKEKCLAAGADYVACMSAGMNL